MLNVDQMLDEFMEKCRNKFGNKLISIVLFGSYAKGTYVKYSDVDLLVVAEGLPENRIARHKILNEVKLEFIYKYHIRISPIFIEPDDLSVEHINPLVYGILTGYRVLSDPLNFWSDFTVKLKPKIHEKRPVYIEDKQQWQIAEMI